jgi:superoxide reductase
MRRRDFIKCGLSAAVISAVPSGALAGFYGEPKKEGFIRLKNKNEPSVSEQKHVPGIESPDSVKAGEWFDVRVRVGFMKEHPSTAVHWITMIKLLVDGETVGKTEFKKGGVAAPFAEFRIKLSKRAKIEAVEHCNLHGTWVSEPLTIDVI